MTTDIRYYFTYLDRLTDSLSGVHLSKVTNIANQVSFVTDVILFFPTLLTRVASTTILSHLSAG